MIRVVNFEKGKAKFYVFKGLVFRELAGFLNVIADILSVQCSVVHIN